MTHGWQVWLQHSAELPGSGAMLTKQPSHHIQCAGVHAEES